MDQLAPRFVLLPGAIVSVPVGEWPGLPSPVLGALFGGVLAALPCPPVIAIRTGLVLPPPGRPRLEASPRTVPWTTTSR